MPSRMLTWGLSAGGHDAAIAVVQDQTVVFAAHAERYSRIKNDPNLNDDLIGAAMDYGSPDVMVWHERPWLAKTREIWAAQWAAVMRPSVEQQLHALGLSDLPWVTVSHHHSHAAGAYYTSGFHNAAVLVVDAMGEWDTTTLWRGRGTRLTRVGGRRYPQSLGLFYSAMTRRCGFKPNEEEYIMMGLAALGDPHRLLRRMMADIIEITPWWPFYRCRFNLHRGCDWWLPAETNTADIAAAAQWIYTEVMRCLSSWAKIKAGSSNLVLCGGGALNCVTNSVIAKSGLWEQIWIMPNPGDAGNSLGAALAHLGQPVTWPGPYLGTKIQGAYPVTRGLETLQSAQLVGIANGPAEWGPRALGNRSLLGDPRLHNIQQLLNRAKKREPFRPFAPVILAEQAGDCFELLQVDHSYMQYVVRCKQPQQYPGIVHVDGTSRIQTVTAAQHAGLYQLLQQWHAATGCAMLVNTSLNVKGQPLVNSEHDAMAFQQAYGITVHCRD